MSGSIDGPTITAYALGDLGGDERAEVEHAVALDADLAARVEAIRATAKSIERGFQAEPLPEPPVRVRPAPQWRLWITGATAAACAVLAVMWPVVDQRPSRSTSADGVVGTTPDDPTRHDLITFSGTNFGITRYVDRNGDQIPDGRVTVDDLRGLVLSAPEYNEHIADQEISLKGEQSGSLLAAMNKAARSSDYGVYVAWNDKYGSLEGEVTKLRAQQETISSVISGRDQMIAQLTTSLDGGFDHVLVDTTFVTTSNEDFAVLGERWSEAPLFERFYAGGSGTLRGLTFRKITADETDAGDTNEDFVAYEDNSDLKILEESLYGLDVDSNYWRIQGELTGEGATGYAAARAVVAEAWRANLSRHQELRGVLKAARSLSGEKLRLPPGAQGPEAPSNTEGYDKIVENPFLTSFENPLSTFSIDVDTASYANVRRFLTGGQLPPLDAVRIEELINYFTYDYAPPTDDRPFAVHMEMASCPWKPDHKLLRIGLKGRTLEKRPPSNLVFLIDVSGSMQETNKLPLVQRSLGLLVNQLSENDRVSIVVYAGASGLVLPPTTGDKKARILDAIERLSAGGSTNGGAGIELAYALAAQNFVQGGTNRVILATDGDWNVGTTSHGALETLIAEKAKTGVFLSVLGFGMGNLKDDTLERLADKGNGNYAYVDSLSEAKKVLVEQAAGTLCTIAKDVKIQIEFNPARIAGYRLIGYENRVLAKEDFNDDKKDAGEIGAGHTVTALYELVPAGQELPGGRSPVDPLKYQQPNEPAGASLDVCTVKLRYKAPESSESTLMEVPLKQGRDRFDDASADFRFAAAVAGYGMLLRRSEYAKGFTWEAVTEIASGALGEDREGYRAEFLGLVKRAKDLSDK